MNKELQSLMTQAFGNLRFGAKISTEFVIYDSNFSNHVF